MRILLVGSHKRWRMESGVERALRRAGHETRLIDDRRARRLLGRRLTQAWARHHLRRFNPNFVFLSKCLGLELETVAELVRDRPSAMWYLDPPYYKHLDRPDIAHIAAVARLAGTFHISGFVDEWRAAGFDARFLPAAGDRDIVPATPDPAAAADVTFIGTGYDEARAELLLTIAQRYRVRVWGRGWDRWRAPLNWNGRAAEGRDFSRACSSASICLGINPRIAEGATSYASNRMWITILAGGFYLGAGTPGVTELLRDGEHCAWYRDEPQCLERIAYYLARPEERERIRVKGEAFVRAHHTFDERVGHLLSGTPWTNPLAAGVA